MNFILKLFFIPFLLLDFFNFTNKDLGFILVYLIENIKINNDISFYRKKNNLKYRQQKLKK